MTALLSEIYSAKHVTTVSFEILTFSTPFPLREFNFEIALPGIKVIACKIENPENYDDLIEKRILVRTQYGFFPIILNNHTIKKMLDYV